MKASVLLLIPLLLASCSMGFKRNWDKAAQASTTTAPSSLEGAWQGTWKSESTGHHGRLRAIVTPVEGSAHDWQFRYHATWAKVLSGSYTTMHTARPDGRGYAISGEHDLGKLLGGTYHYEGRATPAEFRATYRCDIDHGVFEMRRP